MKHDRYPDKETSGILLVDKPSGMTSHDVVDLIRDKFGFAKVGHAGTLDPMATGLLVMLIGRATKFQAGFLNDGKVYDADVMLGVSTDSGDAMGVVVGRKHVDTGEDAVRSAVKKFEGESMQVPPMFSAKKKNGKKLYELARKGLDVKREPVKITIGKIEVLGMALPQFTLRVRCSKGTYIRQLAADIGEALGCGAHLTSLRRLSSGSFSVENAVTAGMLEKLDRTAVKKYIAAIPEARGACPA